MKYLVAVLLVVAGYAGGFYFPYDSVRLPREQAMAIDRQTFMLVQALKSCIGMDQTDLKAPRQDKASYAY